MTERNQPLNDVELAQLDAYWRAVTICWAGDVKQFVCDKLIEHADDLPEVRDWRWSGDSPAGAGSEAGP